MLRFIALLQFIFSIGALAVTFNYNVEPEEVVYADNNRIRGFKDRVEKDIVLGALISVHVSEEGAACSEAIFTFATEFVEAFLYAVDLINSDSSLLPNIKLGYDIRDTCLAESVALDESVDLIILSNEESCSDQQNGSSSVPVSAVIGAAASFVSVPVASFLRLFKTPQISYSSTSVLLSNRDRYGYFFRTVPSDDQQAQAMIDLALYFNWRYVSTIHSNDLYGEPGIEKFKQLAEMNGICIDLDEGIDDVFSPSQYETLTNKIFNSTANVIVMFASHHHVLGLFEHILDRQTRGEKRKFLWIASDAWIESTEVATKYSDIVAGMWGVVPLTNLQPQFFDYFSQLTPSNNKRNPWFKQYYEYYYNCTYDDSCPDQGMHITESPLFSNNSYTPLVIDAVYSFAHALDNFLEENCDKPLVWDPVSLTCQGEANKYNGETLRKFLENVTFTSPTRHQIQFDDTGAVQGSYQIFNYQVDVESSSNCSVLVSAAIWNGTKNGSHLQFASNITHQFGINAAGQPLLSLESQCQQCEPGNVIHAVQSSCCGTCSPCLGQNYTNTTTSLECSTCPDDMWGNKPLVGSNSCQAINEAYLDPTDAWGIVLILVAIIGLIAVVVVSIALIVFWNTAIIKSSGREQMVLLLIGIALCFLVTVFFIVEPSIGVCLFQRFGTWLCFSLIVCSLFVKLVRIARIFLRKNVSARPKFVEPKFQILFTFLLVGGLMLLVIISLIDVHPEATKELVLDSKDTDDFPYFVVTCDAPNTALIVIQMLYLTVLLIVSNALAVLTIRFPANFNEVMYVAFSTFSIGVIWIAYVVIYFATDDRELQTAIIAFAIQMSALAVLICMFCPRIFIMIVWPNKNKTEMSVSKPTDILSSLSANRKGSTQDVVVVNKTADISSPETVEEDKRECALNSPI